MSDPNSVGTVSVIAITHSRPTLTIIACCLRFALCRAPGSCADRGLCEEREMARKFFGHEQFNSEFQFYGGDYAAASRLVELPALWLVSLRLALIGSIGRPGDEGAYGICQLLWLIQRYDGVAVGDLDQPPIRQ